jgi:hypothetical protein
MSNHKVDLRHQAVFTGDVIGVHPRNVFALCEPAASIQGLNQSTVLLMVNLHANIILLIRLQYLGGMVSRAVVNDDELELAQTLVENTLDSFTQKALAVEHTHHD